MKINTKKIRGGDYIEGTIRPANRSIFVSGLITKVDEINKFVHIKGRNYITTVDWNNITQYVSVLTFVFADVNLAKRVLIARNRINDIWELYDRKKRYPKKDRYKIVHKVGK